MLLFVLFLFPGSLELTHTTSFVVFPQDCNHNYPMLFGGKTLSEMDRCAGITTRRLLYASQAKAAVTVEITDLKFRKSGKVGDLIFVTGKVVELGEKTIKIHVKVEREIEAEKELLADGFFIFIAYDVKEKRAINHGLHLE